MVTATTMAWCSMYCVASTLLFLLNKAAVDAWPQPALLLLGSLVCNFAVSAVARHCFPRLLGESSGANDARYMSKRAAVHWAPLSVLFVAMLWSSLQALNIAGIPAVVACRNFGTVITALVEWDTRASLRIFAPLALTFAGSAGYAMLFSDSTARSDYTRLDSSLSGLSSGLAWCMVNMACTVMYDLRIRALRRTCPLSAAGQQFWHCVASVPVLMGAAGATESTIDAQTALRGLVGLGPAALDTRARAAVVATFVLGFGITVSSIQLQPLITATSFGVLRNTNKIVTILINFSPLIGDTLPDPRAALCLFLSLLGGLWYAVQKAYETRPKTE